jgi:hypothetical protein
MKRNACRPVPTQGILLNQCYECGKEVTDDRETKCNKLVILLESIWAVISVPRYIYNPHSHVTPLECNYSYILRFFLCAQVVPFTFYGGYTSARFAYLPFSSTSTSYLVSQSTVWPVLIVSSWTTELSKRTPIDQATNDAARSCIRPRRHTPSSLRPCSKAPQWRRWW